MTAIMAVTVHIYGYLRVLVGRDEVTLDWQGGALRDLLIHLSEDVSEAIGEELFDDDGNIDLAYAIFVNGERADDLSVRIEDGNDVVITSMLAGG